MSYSSLLQKGMVFSLERLQQRECSSKSGLWEILIMKAAKKKAAGK